MISVERFVVVKSFTGTPSGEPIPPKTFNKLRDIYKASLPLTPEIRLSDKSSAVESFSDP
jgi:hypothetical protein